MESNKQKFLKNPTVNPKNNKPIKIGDKTYNQLTEKYGYPKFKSPVTGSKIAVGKITYNNLIKNGMSEDYLLSLLNEDIKINDINNRQHKIDDKEINNDINISLPSDMYGEMIKHMKTIDLLQFCLVNKQINQLCTFNQNLNILRKTLGYKTLACGYANTFIIKNDKLYGIGANNHGQIGIGVQSKGYGIAMKEMNIPSNHKPLSVACGHHHMVVLTTGGLYGAGRNHHSQLTGTERHFLTLTKLKTPGKVLSIACSDETTYIITDEGLFYVGQNIASFDEKVYKFTKMEINDPLNVVCSNTHTTVLTKNGVYWFGRMRRDGQVYSPELINISNDILHISNGTGYTMILTTDGLYGVGANHSGQLGIGYKSDFENNPVLVPIDNVVQTSCQFDTTFMLKSDGNVYMAGENRYNSSVGGYYILLPTKMNLDHITNIVSSHEHTIFQEGELYHGYGSSYHNQLGTGSKYERPLYKNLYFNKSKK